MRVTVVPADKWVRRDDVSAHLTDWPFEDSHIHAIQWYEDHGEMEFATRPKQPNEQFADVSVLDPYLDALDAHLGIEILRARNADGTFMADDPATLDTNEAWVGGVAP